MCSWVFSPFKLPRLCTIQSVGTHPIICWESTARTILSVQGALSLSQKSGWVSVYPDSWFAQIHATPIMLQVVERGQVLGFLIL